MRISSGFDGGNITCISCERADDIRLSIERDNQSEFFQWFYFRLSGAMGQNCRLTITNAGKASYPEGYQDYRAVASYDRETWFRVDTDFDGQNLIIEHSVERDAIYFAYFAPYTTERHADLIADVLNSEQVRLEPLGSTLDGQDMDLLVIGDEDEDKLACWFIARQHPGETMAEWWMEGFLGRLLDEDDPISRELLRHITFYVVPNMNPDGSRRGHLRTNACGANLNREWVEPSMERSPEVYLVRQKMEETGVAFFFDVHGDEGLPYNFISGSDGIPSWDEKMKQFQDSFEDLLVAASPDFQREHGYGADEPGKADLTIASNYVGERFKCPSMTLEMPFKDTADSPNELQGWSPERAVHFGSAALTALYSCLDQLHAYHKA